jgi:hypothetical protein
MFGRTLEGANSGSFTFTFTNGGQVTTGPLSSSIDDDTGSGHGASDFDILTSTCTGPLAGGASCTVEVRFSPPAGTGGAGFGLNRFGRLRVTDGAVVGQAFLRGSSVNGISISGLPAPISFGSLAGGVTSAPVTLTVANNGATTVSITSMCVTTLGDGCPSGLTRFTVIPGSGPSGCAVGRSLDPGGVCTYTATYNPPVGGPFGFDQVEFIVDASSGAGTRQAANGLALAPAGLALSPADGTPDFPTTVSGETSRITYTVSNTGGVATAMAPAISLGGADPGQYSIANSTCTAALAAAGTAAASCTFDVVFAPTSAGVKTATLSINAGGAATASRTLTGTGIGAALLGISPSAPQTCPARAAGTGNNDGQICTVYTITNGGGSPSQPLSIGVTGDFRIETATSSCVAVPTGAAGAVGSAITTAGPATVTGRVINDTGGPACTTGAAGSTAACGATCTVVVQHVPQSVGADSGTLTVGAAGIASVTGTISSSGISAFQHSATAPAAFTEGTVSFGSFAVGAVTGSNQIINFLNRTAPATSVMTYTITGANAGDFDMQSDSCSGGTFGRGLGCATTIRFLPSAVGARTATLTVTDGTPEHTAVITLNGTGS